MKRKRSVSRRTVLAGAFIPVSALAAAPKNSLTAAERKTLQAFVDRLVPHDELGPSASESGVVEYIDRSLGDYLAPEKLAFEKGLSALGAFAELSPAKQDEAITAMESDPNARPFFLRIRQLTMEGMFGDPYYGGNRAYAGWDLIRYPGPRLAVGPEEQKIAVAIKPVRTSAHGGNHGH